MWMVYSVSQAERAHRPHSPLHFDKDTRYVTRNSKILFELESETRSCGADSLNGTVRITSCKVAQIRKIQQQLQ